MGPGIRHERGNGVMDQTGNFFQMGGYAIYVWSSYGITLLVLFINYLFPRIREKKLITRLRKNLDLKNSTVK